MPPQAVSAIQQHIAQIFDELLRHDGYGEFKVELRILKRGQKEVLVHYGKQYRYVLDFPATGCLLPGSASLNSPVVPTLPA